MQRRTLLIAGVTAVMGALVVAAAAIAIGELGWYDVSARSGHSMPVAWALNWVMRQSVAHHAPDQPVPDLANPRLILRGATHFASGCAPCHGAPGQLASPIAKGLLPVPPGLYDAAAQFPPNALYWIVRDGIKMTGMPSWPAVARADEVWAAVAFLEQLPALKTKEYLTLSGGAPETGLLAGESREFDPGKCVRCHGADGAGRDSAFPDIAGLGAQYIADQVRAFRDGSRPSGFMGPVAAELSDRAIEAAARYYSALARPEIGTTADPGLVAEGRTLVNTGTTALPACSTCHGPGGRAANPSIPVISGQPADYLLTQLQLFARGVRSGTPAAQTMSRLAGAMTEQQMEAAAAFLGGTD